MEHLSLLNLSLLSTAQATSLQYSSANKNMKMKKSHMVKVQTTKNTNSD